MHSSAFAKGCSGSSVIDLQSRLELGEHLEMKTRLAGRLTLPAPGCEKMWSGRAKLPLSRRHLCKRLGFVHYNVVAQIFFEKHSPRLYSAHEA